MKYVKSIEEYPEFLTARDVGELLRFGYTKTLNFIQYSGIRYFKIGNSYRVKKSDFIAWAETEETKIVEIFI